MGTSVTSFDHWIRQEVTAARVAWSAVFARAPASTANLGPGFDALAIALDLGVDVQVEPADRLSVTAVGEGADLPTDANHLAARVVRGVTGHDRWAITVRSEIPVGREGVTFIADRPASPRVAVRWEGQRCSALLPEIWPEGEMPELEDIVCVREVGL